MEEVCVTVIGAGVVGLAVAREISSPEKTLVILEKNPRHGQETSSRNSEVIHAGIYYKKNTLKARLCIEGKNMLYEYCAKNNIPFRNCGKIIVACAHDEEKALAELFKLGAENDVPLKLISSSEIKKLEPQISACAGMLSPTTGILSADALMDSYLKKAESRGAIFLPQCEVIGIEKKTCGYEIKTNSQESFLSRIVINCAGHNAHKVAAMPGIDAEAYRQKFIKGEYFRLTSKHHISRLIYPLPGETSLGIHLTPDLKNSIRLGP
ncbi:MAG: NAD(P)/FAD-dependent oxidoreductase, partial [Elusimicrobia bacterium]|nr:NAD(P)/FAD-dependent oxidoreductase [Elusimicrobiota bacterium]